MAEAASQPAPTAATLTGFRLAAGYVVVGVFAAVAITISITLGNGREPARAIGGIYHAAGGCLAGDTVLMQSGEFVNLDGPGSTGGKLRLDGTRLTGDITCADGATGALAVTVAGTGEDASLV